ncbi:MAG TPA: head GIN domain-containing protein [Bacteroidia bacterium]|nr:head GIN domain-containing protein [Bacteroidia bacterium]
MKSIHFTILFLVVVLFSSCKKQLNGSGQFTTEQRNLPAFTKVELDENFRVNLVQDSESFIEMYGEDNILPEIETEVLAGRLTIRFIDYRQHYDHNGVTLTVHSPSFNTVDLRGSGNMVSRGILSGPVMNVRLSGSGVVDLALDTMDVRTALSGSGNILLMGVSLNAEHQISGSGDIRSYNLTSIDTRVAISGSGDCEVSAYDHLDVTISGSGNVFYQGAPHVETHISGCGNVVHQ